MSTGTIAVGRRDTEAVRPTRAKIEARKENLELESRFKDLGAVYWGLALVWMIATVTISGGSMKMTGDPGLILFFYVGVPVILGLLGYSVYSLVSWARPFAALVCLLLIVTPPRGFLRGLQGLRDLGSAEGRLVFSKKHRDIRKTTRHLRASMSTLMRAVLVGLALMLGYLTFNNL